MIVAPDVLAVLDRAEVEGPALRLAGQIERKLYERTDKVLRAAGGKWDRKARVHLFEGEAAEALEPIFLTGSIVGARQELGVFYTPAPLAEQVMLRAGIVAGMAVLEPSAGRGALAAPALLRRARVDCVEIDPRSVRILASMAFRQVVEADFLTLPSEPMYDRVVMNPPFAKGQDCAHVLHALRFLRPGGRLVAIMAAGITFRDGAAWRQVREAVARKGLIEPLPPGSFKAAGTAVNVALVTIEGERA